MPTLHGVDYISGGTRYAAVHRAGGCVSGRRGGVKGPRYSLMRYTCCQLNKAHLRFSRRAIGDNTALIGCSGGWGGFCVGVWV